MRDRTTKYPLLACLLLLSYFVRVYYQHIGNPLHMSLLASASLGFHEMGHVIFGVWGSELLGVMGGTIFQLLVPIGVMRYFARRKDHFAVALGRGWLAVNFYYIAMYAGDANDRVLPMLNPFGNEGLIHDWTYMFLHFDVYNLTDFIAAIFEGIGSGCMLICFLYGGWLVVNTYWLKRT